MQGCGTWLTFPQWTTSTRVRSEARDGGLDARAPEELHVCPRQAPHSSQACPDPQNACGMLRAQPWAAPSLPACSRCLSTFFQEAQLAFGVLLAGKGWDQSTSPSDFSPISSPLWIMMKHFCPMGQISKVLGSCPEVSTPPQPQQQGNSYHARLPRPALKQPSSWGRFACMTPIRSPRSQWSSVPKGLTRYSIS